MKVGQKFPVHDGEVVDGYVIGPIFAASGGMSHLFNVSDPALPLLPLVMKVLPLDRTPDMVARMEREAYALSKMSGSDLIVRIQATGRCSDGSPYIVMERLNGEDLKEFLKRSGPLEMSRAVDIAVRAALALYTCHCAEVLHRDMKPGNLFLHKEAGMRQVVKLLDFGISHTGVGPAITGINAYSGTRRYMAPEQWRGQDTEMADQFSLAVVLFEMLTGRLPWPIPRNDDRGQHERLLLAGKFNRLREVRSEMPASLEAVIARALACDPELRFPSVYEFGQALLPLASEAAQSFFGEYVPEGRQARSSAGVAPLRRPLDQGRTASLTNRGGPAAAAPRIESEYATVPSQVQGVRPAGRRSYLVGALLAVGVLGGGVMLLSRQDAHQSGANRNRRAGLEQPELQAATSGALPVQDARADSRGAVSERGPMETSTTAAAESGLARAPGAHIQPLLQAEKSGQGTRKPNGRNPARSSSAAQRNNGRVPYSQPRGANRGSAIPD